MTKRNFYGHDTPEGKSPPTAIKLWVEKVELVKILWFYPALSTMFGRKVSEKLDVFGRTSSESIDPELH